MAGSFKNLISRSKYFDLELIAAWCVFFTAATFYLLTADRFASYWDCPEYITVASLMEVGHPPGNPVWTLAMRVATVLFPRSLHPAVINACSGLLMAGAAFFLCRILYHFIALLFKIPLSRNLGKATTELMCILASVGGSICFVFCDSTWFSAVESEVYAMSAFMFSLIIWLAIKWTKMNPPASTRQMYLIAYLLGLSLGIHQLNLLGIPVIAFIWLYGDKNRRISKVKLLATLLISFGLVCVILTGMMPGILSWARIWEWHFVNSLQLPYHCGVILYLASLFYVFIVSALVTAGNSISSLFKAAMTWLLLALGGFFAFGGSLIAGSILSLIFIVFIYLFCRRKVLVFSNIVWCAGFLILGFSSFAVIYIRSLASPPLNEGAPSDIFAFSSYIGREQYGSTPLLYGPTPLSKPMVEEHLNSSGKPEYPRYLFQKGNPRIGKLFPEAHIYQRTGLATIDDSLSNAEIIENRTHGYIVSDYNIIRETTPELNMWFPRMTSMAPEDFKSYSDWSGMDYDNMVEVEISETKDSLGNYVTKMSDNGNRERKTSFRPTYLQQLRYFLAYQSYYMYFRYLLWNFYGRQNDFPSIGEIERGNFITGIDFLDRIMVGYQNYLPPYAGKENSGRNIYYGIPFILGMVGLVFLTLMKGKRASGIFWITFVWFVMTGIAIVVYLNQSPGEPRERDYTFIANYMVFSCWIGFGLMVFLRWLSGLLKNRKVLLTICFLFSLSPGILMASVNFDDHDRRGRGQPLEYVSGVLGMKPPTIIFTQGDNYSFPLWYGQEVEGLGKHHTIIDVSYLSSPKYVLNLMKQGDRGIKITARPGDIMFDAFAFVGIAKDADTTAVPLIHALKDLYSQKEERPEFRFTKVILPSNSEDSTAIIDLKELYRGKFINFSQLMMLDIIASNFENGGKKLVYFLNPVSSSLYKPLEKFLQQDIYGKIYYPGFSDSLRHKYLSDNIRLRLESLQGHGLPAYIDPVMEDQMMRRRGELVIASKELSRLGFYEEAAETLKKAFDIYPIKKIRPGQMIVSDSLFHETLETIRLWNEIFTKSGNQEAFERAMALCDTLKDFTDDWMKYYDIIPQARLGAVSRVTRNLLSVKPRIDSIHEQLTIQKSKMKFEGRDE